MNYDDLKTAIQETCVDEFTEDQLALFVKQAEQKLFQTVDLPVSRKNQTAQLQVGEPYLEQPESLLHVYSLAITDVGTSYQYLLPKDVSFMREAYPNPAYQGVPRYYGFFDAQYFILAPSPSQAFTVELHFSAYPESIVTAGETWLGEHFDAALLNGALIEAARHMKEEADVIAVYDKLYLQAVTLLKGLGDGKLKRDTYRNGQMRMGG